MTPQNSKSLKGEDCILNINKGQRDELMGVALLDHFLGSLTPVISLIKNRLLRILINRIF